MKPYLCLLYILIILFWGLRPFNFQPSNGATWLKTGNGVNFHNHGIVYGPSKFKDLDQVPLFAKHEPISIEIWLTPDSDYRRGFSYIFGLYDDHFQEIFSLSHVKSLLNISKYKKPGKRGLTYNWRWLKNTFFKGQKRFLTIVSDKNSTTVYLDGWKVKKYRNYSLMLSRKQTSACRMVIGNDPSGTKAWTGKIHGLAIYNRALSPEEVIKNFKKWSNKSALSLLKEKDIIALYPMDEKSGQLIHNAVPNHFHSSIPARFRILKKNFLRLDDNALKLNCSSLRDMCINILGFIPLGWFLFWTFNLYSQPLKTPSCRPMLLAVLGGTVISLMVEILQAYLPTRNSSLSDLIYNSFGTGLGVILAVIFIKIKNPIPEDVVF